MVDPELETWSSPWRTYRECLARTPEGATHRVILQDDAEPCEHFLSALGLAIAARPESLICLFVSRELAQGARAVMEACGRGEAWAALPMTGNTFVPVVGLVWPTSFIPSFLEWSEERFPVGNPRHRSDDAIVGRYCADHSVQVWATVPSLVEHPDDTDSLIGLRTASPRRAACFAGDSALLIDW